MAWRQFIPIYSIFVLIAFYLIGLYRSIWRFAGFEELIKIVKASIVTMLFHTVFITVLYTRMPLSYYIIGAGIQFMAVMAIRFSYRFYLRLVNSHHHNSPSALEKNVMLIGAGSSGQMILRDITKAKEVQDRVVCIIDDNPNKWNRTMEGVPVVGGRDEILSSVEKYKVDKIYLAIPSATAEQKRDILNICSQTDCELKQLPGMYQFLVGEIAVSKMKDVSVEDLLGREPIRADLREVYEYINGKTVLVTGGGGSIGSELCRQIAGHNPRRLIIFDVYENNAYNIQLELKKKYPTFVKFKEQFEIPQSVTDDIIVEAEKQKIKPKDDGELQKTLPYLRLQLKALVARDLWETSQYFAIMNETNDIVCRALELMGQ